MSSRPRPIALLLLYSALVVWLTWPLATRLGTALPEAAPGTHLEPPLLAWTLATEARGLTGGGFGDAPIYHPASHALFLGETAFGALPLFLPPYLLGGNPTLALNLTFLALLAITACAVHVVVHRWTRSGLAGAVAASALLTSRWFIEGTAATPHAAALMYLPGIMLLAATPRPTGRTAFALVALVVAQGACGVDLAVTVVVLLALLAAGHLAWPTTRARGVQLLAVLTFALPALLLVYVGYLIGWTEYPGLLAQRFPEAAAAPTVPGIPWSAESALEPWAMAWPLVVVAGLGAIATIAAARRGSQDVLAPWRAAAFWTLAGLALSVADGGATGMPARFGAVSLVGHAVLAGLGFAACEDVLVRTLRPRWTALRRTAGWLTLGVRVGLAVVVILACRLAYLDGPPVVAEAYATVPAIGADDPLAARLARGTGPVLEVPTWRDLEDPRTPAAETRAMYRALHHHRPVLNGYRPFWPTGFLDRAQLAARLPDPEAVAMLRAQTDLATIVVHLGELTADEAARWQAATDGARSDLRLTDRLDDTLVFDVLPPA